METNNTLRITRYTEVSDIPPELGLEGYDFGGICAVINCEWPDRSGYYFQHEDGTFSALVFNESEVFATEPEAQAWVFERVETNT